MSEGSTADPWPELSTLPMGARVEVTDPQGSVWLGTVVPRHAFSGDRILQLKLGNGYNVGLHIGSDFRFRDLGPTPANLDSRSVAPPVVAAVGAPVTLLTTGGTIASRVDYETGGVRPVTDEAELLAFYPELQRTGPVRIVPVFDRLSEEFHPDDWAELARQVVLAFEEGAHGVVIAHGTDTLGYTAAALSFLLVNLPGPVVLVGAQRSPDRPSSDGASNLEAAVTVARTASLGEVVVVMHEGLSDGRYAIHRGTVVRKMHSSRRDAFESRNVAPLGRVVGGRVELSGAARSPRSGPARVDGPIDARAGLLWMYPGLTPEQGRRFAEGLRGVVLAGTGLGHAASAHLEWIRPAIDAGQVVAMTTQCLAGNADPYVYATGRDLVRAGVVYLDDLLPETAYAKMVWALGHAPDAAGVVDLLRRDLVGEFTARHLLEGSA